MSNNCYIQPYLQWPIVNMADGVVAPRYNPSIPTFGAPRALGRAQENGLGNWSVQAQLNPMYNALYNEWEAIRYDIATNQLYMRPTALPDAQHSQYVSVGATPVGIFPNQRVPGAPLPIGPIQPIMPIVGGLGSY